MQLLNDGGNNSAFIFKLMSWRYKGIRFKIKVKVLIDKKIISKWSVMEIKVIRTLTNVSFFRAIFKLNQLWWQFVQGIILNC